jgi:hypothetical protein
MSARQMRKRLDRLAAQSRSTDGRTTFIGMEDVYRHYWRIDKQGFIKYANEPGSMCRLLVEQFEREDAERDARR